MFVSIPLLNYLIEGVRSPVAAAKVRRHRRQQARILDLFGTVPFDPSYNYKAERYRRSDSESP